VTDTASRSGEVEKKPQAGTVNSSSISRLFWLGLLLITGVAAFLRLWQLADFPLLFNQDEKVLGYDAWSVWLTRRDQHGAFLPIHFQTFNDYVPPVANYLTAPFVGLLGLSEFSTRLPFALLGTATVFLSGLLGRALFGRVAGLITALLLTFEPWHITYSRVAFPASLVPFWTVCTLFFFVTALQQLNTPPPKHKRAGVLLALSGISLGLLFMEYTTEKVNAPVLALICFVAGAGLLWRYKNLLFCWIGAVLLTASPVILEQLLNWNKLQGHFNGISIFGEKDPWWLALPRNYTSYYNPSALFFDGFKEGVTVHSFGIGELLWLELLLWLVAFVGLIRHWQPNKTRLNPSWLLLGWFFTFPLAASTGVIFPHEIRSLNFLPLPELLAGYGALLVWQHLRTVWRGVLRVALALLAVGLLVLNAGVFLVNFFPDRSQVIDVAKNGLPPANLGFDQMARAAAERLQPCDTLWIENFNQSYIYYLFDTRYPPRRYQQDNKLVTIKNPNDIWQTVQRFGQVYVGTPSAKNYRATPETLSNCPNPTGGKVYWITRESPNKWGDTGLEWNGLEAFKDAAGRPVWNLVELKQ
jgi:4-amino-4-deoxy-L-arabinose transferase-like glycosyltransferase